MAELLKLEGGKGTATLPRARVTEDPEEVADRGRTALGVSVQEQHGWGSPENALRAWITAIEALGVLVLRTSEVSADETGDSRSTVTCLSS